MKKIFFACLFVLAILFAGCDKDECPVCHECECVCPKEGT
jgi:hypothetical protein